MKKNKTASKKKSIIPRFNSTIYCIFFVIICILTWKILDIKNKMSILNKGVGNHEYEVFFDYFGESIPKFSLMSLDQEIIYDYDPDNNNFYHLFIFFTPWDCNSCFDEVPFWKEISERFENRLKVIGIGSSDSIEMLKHFVEKNNIKILTLYDLNNFLFLQLRLKDSFVTPIKFLTNEQGIILHISMTMKKDTLKLKKYINLLEQILPKSSLKE